MQWQWLPGRERCSGIGYQGERDVVVTRDREMQWQLPGRERFSCSFQGERDVVVVTREREIQWQLLEREREMQWQLLGRERCSGSYQGEKDVEVVKGQKISAWIVPRMKNTTQGLEMIQFSSKNEKKAGGLVVGNVV